jgi:hypothetical protein|tara:strand:+ start:252 stop:1085 length:834 start_codon:yes stop_codon:yes gene_type:complete
MDNQQVEATSTADGLVDGGADIVQEVREQTDAQYEQQADQPVEEAVDYSAPEVSVESETTPVNEWEVEARKFQSMYDKSIAENEKLRKFEPLGQLLEQRPDLVNMLQENINAPQQPQQQQQQGQPALKPEDFNPWDAYYSPESPSFKFRLNQEMQLAKDVVDNAMAQQKRQMQEEITYNNTVNELRNTYKFSDGDVQEFMGFVTQPKESVGLSNLVKLFRDVKNKGNAPETAQAVQNAQQQPRTAGVLQGGAPSSPKSTENQVWDNIVNAGSRTSVL